jgi:hypothetical protein
MQELNVSIKRSNLRVMGIEEGEKTKGYAIHLIKY